MDGFNKPLGVVANNQSIQTVTTIQTTVSVWAPCQYTVLYVYPAHQFVNLTGVPVGLPPNIGLYSHRIAPYPPASRLRSLPASQGSAAPRPVPQPGDRKPLQDEHYHYMRRSHNDSLEKLSDVEWHYVAHILKPEMEMCGFKLENEDEALKELKQLCATQDIVTFEALETAVLERHSEDTPVKPLVADSLLRTAGTGKAGEISKDVSTSSFSALNITDDFLSKVSDIELEKSKNQGKPPNKPPNKPANEGLELAAQPHVRAVANNPTNTASIIHTPSEARLDGEHIYAEIPPQHKRRKLFTKWLKRLSPQRLKERVIKWMSSKNMASENKPVNSRDASYSVVKPKSEDNQSVYSLGDPPSVVKPESEDNEPVFSKSDYEPYYSEPPFEDNDYLTPKMDRTHERDDRK